MKPVLIAAVACILLSGCATQRFDINKPIGPAGEPTLDTSQAFFIEGLGQESLIDAAEICGGVERIARVETEETFLDGLLGFLSAGIYTPKTARVYCLLGTPTS